MTNVRPNHMLLLEVDARTLAKSQSGQLLEALPDSWFIVRKNMGFSCVWLRGTWLLSENYANATYFACDGYLPGSWVGGMAGLAKFRMRLQKHGMKLILDFFANQIAAENAIRWIHPQWLVQKKMETDFCPAGWLSQAEDGEGVLIAQGKDPNYPPISHTLQLNLLDRGLRDHLQDTVARLATVCDGIWCSQAMLAIPGVMRKTWGKLVDPADGMPPAESDFWTDLLAAGFEINPKFMTLAEVYWNLEWDLMQQGFNYCLDQRLLERLERNDYSGLSSHLQAPLEFLGRTLHRPSLTLARDLLNRCRYFPGKMAVFLLSPGMKVVHEEVLVELTEIERENSCLLTGWLEWIRIKNVMGTEVQAFKAFACGIRRESACLGLCWLSRNHQGEGSGPFLLFALMNFGANCEAIHCELPSFAGMVRSLQLGCHFVCESAGQVRCTLRMQLDPGAVALFSNVAVAE